VRFLDVHYHAHGDEFRRLCPALAGWPVPVLRIALRRIRTRRGLPATPVIHHDGPTAMVWTVDPSVPTLVRVRSLLPGNRAELDTDAGPYIAPVLRPAQVAVVCRRLCEPARPGKQVPFPTHLPGLADTLRDLHTHAARYGTLPATAGQLADTPAALAVAAHLWPAILTGLLGAVNDTDPSALRAVEVPDVADRHGRDTAAALTTAAAELRAAIGDLTHLADQLSNAHLHLDRLRPAADL
jgi:hypothetical protein